jgi:hypothetical protein
LPEPENPKPKITKTAVVKRPGWTATLVTRLLGGPDERLVVRGYSYPLALYVTERVEQAEASPEFSAEQEGQAKRKAASVKAVATKVERLLASINEMDVKVVCKPMAQLREDAIRNYNRAHPHDPPYGTNPYGYSIEHVMVNYIRHTLTDYDYELEKTAGKTGKQIGYNAISKVIFAAIAEAYPDLAEECARQLARPQREARPPGEDVRRDRRGRRR